MSARGEAALCAAGCVAVLLLSHGAYLVAESSADDRAYHRTAAWASAYPDDPVLAQARDHLAAHREALGDYRHERYRLRLLLRNHCPAHNAMVRALERGPLPVPALSVPVAELVLAILGLALALAALSGGLGPAEARALRWAYPLACAPCLLFWPIGLGAALPFATSVEPWSEHGWATPAPRAQALACVFAAVAVACRPRGGALRLILVVCLLLAAAVSHLALLLVHAAALAGVCLFWWALPALEPHRLYARWGATRFFAVLAAVVVAVAAAKLAYLWAAGCRELHLVYPTSLDSPHGLLRNLVRLAGWTSLYGALVALWLSGDRSADPFGRRLFRLFLAVGGCAIGLNAFHPGLSRWYSDLMWITEACRRLNGLAALLGWAVLSLWAVRRGTVWAHPALAGRAALVLALLLACAIQALRLSARHEHWARLWDLRLAEQRAPALLDEPGLAAYADEALYYHALANELGARHGAGPYRNRW